MEVLRRAGPWVPSLLSLSVCSSPSPRKGPGTYSTQGSPRLDDSSLQSRSGEARAGPRTGLHLAVTEALPGTRVQRWQQPGDAHLTVTSYSVGSRAKSECIRLTAWRKRRSCTVATCGRLAARRGHGSHHAWQSAAPSTPKPRTTKTGVEAPQAGVQVPSGSGDGGQSAGPSCHP